jgi:hypothetical protein
MRLMTIGKLWESVREALTLGVMAAVSWTIIAACAFEILLKGRPFR